MQTHKTFFALATAAVILLASSTVQAQEAPRNVFGVREGLMVEGALFIHALTDDDYILELYDPFDGDVIYGRGSKLGPMIGLAAAVLYRPIQYVSVGLLLHYGFLYADAPNLRDERAGAFLMLAEVRGHFPFNRFEVWGGFGFGYAMTYAAAEDVLEFWEYGRFALHGVGLSLSAGFSIYVTERLAVVPYFRFAFGIWPTACRRLRDPLIGSDSETCDNIEDIYGVRDRDDLPDLPFLWSVGVAVNYTFL